MTYDDDELWISSDQCNFDWYEDTSEVESYKEKPKKRDKDGCFCEKCNEFCQFAEPNSMNDTFVCYSCRTTWG